MATPSNPNPVSETDKLATLVQSLPRELFDEIQSLTFDIPTGTTITIDDNSTHPNNVLATRHNRMLYYNCNDFKSQDHISLAKWLKPLWPHDWPHSPCLVLFAPARGHREACKHMTHRLVEEMTSHMTMSRADFELGIGCWIDGGGSPFRDVLLMPFVRGRGMFWPKP